MSILGLPIFASAFLLGVTHALEPDHVAGISAVATGSGDSRVGTLTGSAFGAGHAVLVVVWVGLWYVLDGLGVVPAWMDGVGTTLVAVLLATFAIYLGVAGVRRLVHRHEHTHDDHTHAHYHVHIPFVPHADTAHGHDHTAAGYLRMGVLGALFTLSPPVSMIAFLATVQPVAGELVVWSAIAVYSVTIVAAMASIGFGVGRAAGRLERHGARVHGALQLVTAIVLFGVAVHALLPTL